MSWHKEWKAIEKSISDFKDICKDFVSAMGVQKSDAYGTKKNEILPMACEIAERITILGQRYSSQLPTTALERIKELEDLHFESGCITPVMQKDPTSVAHFSTQIAKVQIGLQLFDFGS